MKLPKENAYWCAKCNLVLSTVDVDYGVTPMFMPCEKCHGPMRSSGYPKLPRPDHIPAPTHEWYRPTAAETEGLIPPLQEHVNGGGLLIRPRTARPPVYHNVVQK